MKKNNKGKFIYFFMILLFLTEIFSSQNFGFQKMEPEGGIPVLLSGQVQTRESAVFIKRHHSAFQYDIDINRNLVNIGIKLSTVRGEARSFKTIRRIGKTFYVFLKNTVLYAAFWFRSFSIFLLVGIGLTHGLRCIIEYIYYKNGEKMKRFLSYHLCSSLLD